MFDSGNFRARVIGVFIVICIALISASLAVIAKGLMALTLTGTIVTGVAIFIGLYLLHGLRRLKRAVFELEYQASSPSDLENSLTRRIDELSRKIHMSSRSSRENGPAIVDELKSSICDIEQELTDLSARVEGLAVEIRNQGAAETTVVALHKPIERGSPVGSPKHADKILTDSSDVSSREYSGEIEPGIPNGAENLMSHARNRSIGERLLKAVELDSLELHLQPVVNLGDREPAFYESTLRLEDIDGQYIDPERLKKSAKREGVATVLDGRLLFSAVRVLRTLNELNKRTGLFCPLSQSTLDDAEAFEETILFLTANIALAGSLMLEIDQAIVADMNSERRDRLSQIVDLGFVLVLDRVENFDLDGTALHAAGFRYLKVSVNALLQIADDGDIDDHVTDFSEDMENCGITVIVTEIEQESQVIHLIDFDLPFGQGSLFAPSRPVKPELLKPVDNNYMSSSNLA